MSRPQRIAQYIQRLAYESLIAHEEREVRPDDAPRAPDPVPDFAMRNVTLFSSYVPFKAPPNR